MGLGFCNREPEAGRTGSEKISKKRCRGMCTPQLGDAQHWLRLSRSEKRRRNRSHRGGEPAAPPAAVLVSSSPASGAQLRIRIARFHSAEPLKEEIQSKPSPELGFRPGLPNLLDSLKVSRSLQPRAGFSQVGGLTPASRLHAIP